MSGPARSPRTLFLPKRLALVLVLPLVAPLAVGCASSSSSDPSSEPPAPSATTTDTTSTPTVSCEADPRIDTYVANLEKTSTAGMKVTLVSSDPAPPIRGTNNWSLKVENAPGEITVVPFMPDHGHGTSVKPTVEAAGPGAWNVKNLYFFMPGVWRVTIASGTDNTQFFFCVAG